MSGRMVDLGELTWDELGELTRPGIPSKVRGQVMREMGARPEALTFGQPVAHRPSPTACSNAGHDVDFRSGVRDRCHTCDVEF